MAAYKLGDVLGGMLTAITEAQYISDKFSESLFPEYTGDNELDLMAIPNTEFSRVQLRMSFAIADLELQATAVKSGDDNNGRFIPSQVMVLVDARDLDQLPDKAISHLDVELTMRNMEALPEEKSEPQVLREVPKRE